MAVYSDEKIEFFNRATRDSSFKMPEPHFHNKHEMYFVEKGKTQYFVGSEIFFLNAGELMFVPKELEETFLIIYYLVRITVA